MVHGVGRGGCHAKAWSEQEACASEDGATAGLGKALDQPDHSEGGDGFGAIGSTAALYRPLHHQGFPPVIRRSEEHTSELQSLMRISYAVFCLKKKNKTNNSK